MSQSGTVICQTTKNAPSLLDCQALYLLGHFWLQKGSFFLYDGITLSNKSVRKHAVGCVCKSHAYACAGMIINSGKPLKFTHSKEEQEVKRKEAFCLIKRDFLRKLISGGRKITLIQRVITALRVFWLEFLCFVFQINFFNYSDIGGGGAVSMKLIYKMSMQ